MKQLSATQYAPPRAQRKKTQRLKWLPVSWYKFFRRKFKKLKQAIEASIGRSVSPDRCQLPNHPIPRSTSARTSCQEGDAPNPKRQFWQRQQGPVAEASPLRFEVKPGTGQHSVALRPQPPSTTPARPCALGYRGSPPPSASNSKVKGFSATAQGANLPSRRALLNPMPLNPRLPIIRPCSTSPSSNRLLLQNQSGSVERGLSLRPFQSGYLYRLPPITAMTVHELPKLRAMAQSVPFNGPKTNYRLDGQLDSFPKEPIVTIAVAGNETQKISLTLKIPTATTAKPKEQMENSIGEKAKYFSLEDQARDSHGKLGKRRNLPICLEESPKKRAKLACYSIPNDTDYSFTYSEDIFDYQPPEQQSSSFLKPTEPIITKTESEISSKTFSPRKILRLKRSHKNSCEQTKMSVENEKIDIKNRFPESLTTTAAKPGKPMKDTFGGEIFYFRKVSPCERMVHFKVNYFCCKSRKYYNFYTHLEDPFKKSTKLASYPVSKDTGHSFTYSEDISNYIPQAPQASEPLPPEAVTEAPGQRTLADYGYDTQRYPLLTQLPDDCFPGRFILKNFKPDYTRWLNMEEKSMLWGARRYPETADFFKIDPLIYRHPHLEQAINAYSPALESLPGSVNLPVIPCITRRTIDSAAKIRWCQV